MRPDLILVSTSARTRQTAELVLRELDSQIDYRDTLYLAEPGKILAPCCRPLPPVADSVMVVGHNPGLEEPGDAAGARAGAAQGARAPRCAGRKFPTAALAVLDFDVGRWRDLRPGEGKLVDFVRPKDL